MEALQRTAGSGGMKPEAGFIYATYEPAFLNPESAPLSLVYKKSHSLDSMRILSKNEYF